MTKLDLEPEMTAEEHWDLLSDEISHDDLMVMAVRADIVNGKDKRIALQDHGITEDFYDANIERVLHP